MLGIVRSNETVTAMKNGRANSNSACASIPADNGRICKFDTQSYQGQVAGVYVLVYQSITRWWHALKCQRQVWTQAIPGN